MLIVESLVDKKRFPAYGNEKIISLGDIAIYTDTEEVPLKDVLLSMKKKGKQCSRGIGCKKKGFCERAPKLIWRRCCLILTHDRVYVSDIKN